MGEAEAGVVNEAEVDVDAVFCFCGDRKAISMLPGGLVLWIIL